MSSFPGTAPSNKRGEPPETDFRVTLLGTGAPPPDHRRFGPATLAEAGAQKLVFDAGRGVPIRLWRVS